MRKSLCLIIRSMWTVAPPESRSRRIPKGFCHKAQGCEERATLGKHPVTESTLKGLWRGPVLRKRQANQDTTLSGLNFVRHREPRVARASQPWAGGHNPFGIVSIVI